LSSTGRASATPWSNWMSGNSFDPDSMASFEGSIPKKLVLLQVGVCFSELSRHPLAQPTSNTLSEIVPSSKSYLKRRSVPFLSFPKAFLFRLNPASTSLSSRMSFCIKSHGFDSSSLLGGVASWLAVPESILSISRKK
jgi:hypothetical protein